MISKYKEALLQQVVNLDMEFFAAMKTEELIRYYKANIEAIEKGLNNDSLSADKKFRLGYTQQALDGYKSALQELLGNNND